MKQSSLQRVFIVPFVLLMICLALTIGGVLYQAGEDATDTLSQKVLTDMVGRIEHTAERHLLSAHTTLRSVAPAPVAVTRESAPVHIPFPEDAEELEKRFWIATDLFPDVNRYVYFGGTDGSFIGVNRNRPGEIELRLKAADEPTVGAPTRGIYSMAGPGKRIALLRVEKYDPRERPWYMRAVAQRKATWSPIYTDFYSGEPLLTLAKPIYRADQSLVGVVSTDLSLQALTGFLQSLSISKNGVAFIAERSGALIATSAAEMPYRLDKSVLMRLSATESSLPLVREAYGDVMEALPGRNDASRVIMRSFEGEQGRVQLAAALFQDDAGLDWIMVVAVPRADFMSSVTQGIYKSLSLGLVAMFVALVLGFVVLKWALRDIRKLTLAVRSLGSGEPFPMLDIDRSDEIGQLAHSFEEMERNLRTDRLTHVINRESLVSQIEFRLHNASHSNPLRFALLFIDLDNFKFINDFYGHDSGDRVLIEVASRLLGAVRREDSVARFGGDEFVVYLHGIDSDGLVHSISEKVRAVLEEPIAVRDDVSDRVGASIGSARYPLDGEDVETLIRTADTRMFTVKRARKAA